MNRESRSSLQRIRLAYRENFGELFYGLFRRQALLNKRSDNVDFEYYELIHSVLKAMLEGDAYVTKEFAFIKDVSEATYIWTYLCARSKNSQSIAGEADDLIKVKCSQGRPSSPVLFVAKSCYASARWHFLYFASVMQMIVRAPVGTAEKLLVALDVAFHMLKSSIWTVYARTRYMGALL